MALSGGGVGKLRRAAGDGGGVRRVLTADELVVLASRRFGGQLGVAMAGLRDAVAKNANLADLDGTLNVRYAVLAFKH